MGLTSWEKALEGKIQKTDVFIAKNYLSKDELESLGRIVNAYLDLAEERAKRKIPMTMEDWAKRLDLFLSLTVVLSCRIVARSQPNSQNPMLRVSLKNTELSRIVCSRAILTGPSNR